MLLYVALGLVLALSLWRQLRAFRRRGQAPGPSEGEAPRGQHPLIDVTRCIGCAACIDACPEDEVLALVGGRATIAHGQHCIGHGLCADACPVGAIQIVTAAASVTADTPCLTPELQTSIENLFVVGELGGLALIKNAINQGRDCVDTIARRIATLRARRPTPEVLDVVVIGAGPAGLSASLRAVERQLTALTCEQEDLGGTVAKYPRQKLVLTSPVEFPLVGRFDKLEVSKEALLDFWAKAARRARLAVRAQERVDHVRKDADGIFAVETSKGLYRAHTVILAIGRRGTPRKLGIPGEELRKVMYSLIDAEAYTGRHILVVGGGDSAVEAAMGLARQRGNHVTLSYRQAAFARLKTRNARRIAQCAARGELSLVFNSTPVEIGEDRVVLQVDGQRRTIANDYVWVFAGGTPPTEFLGRIGVRLGAVDLTAVGGAALPRAAGAP